MKLQFMIPIALALLSATLAHAYEIKICQMDERNQRAVEYCGTRPSGGKCQFEMLLQEGLQKEDYVLEIGCGTLMSAIPIMSFLEKGHYVGIEPNHWVKEASLKIPENLAVIRESQPTFLDNLNFDASESGISFQYIFAHSIMSHAAYWQLPLFLENCAKVLDKGGKVIFSIRLTEGNHYGSSGSPEETRDQEWQYPGCSFFHKETVVNEALKWFSKVEHRVDFTEFLTNDCWTVYHDWFVLTK